MSQEDLNSVLDDDDDHDSFASLLEHETAGFIREDDKASAPPSTPPSVKTTPTPGKMHASTAAKVQKRIFTIKDCEHISRPAPQNVIDRIKAGTKRAVSAVHVYIHTCQQWRGGVRTQRWQDHFQVHLTYIRTQPYIHNEARPNVRAACVSLSATNLVSMCNVSCSSPYVLSQQYVPPPMNAIFTSSHCPCCPLPISVQPLNLTEWNFPKKSK